MVRLEWNFSEKASFCSRGTAGTCKLSDSALEYNTIFDERYATMIHELHAGTRLIPNTKVTSIHYQTLSERGTTWRIDIKNLSICSLQGLMLLFLDKHDDLGTKMKNLTTLPSQKYKQQ